jgi:hypothetical protein
MSKICASTVRRDPNRRVENQMNSKVLYRVTAPARLMTSLRMVPAGPKSPGGCGGRNLSTIWRTSEEVVSGDWLSRYTRPVARSRKKGTTASRMLKAMPPARKKTLSSPLLSHTRFA